MVTPPDEWDQEALGSASELAARLGVAVWVPSEWSSPVDGLEILVMRSPGQDRTRDGYHLHGTDSAGRLLVVAGHRRKPDGHLASGLHVVAGERFETLASDANRIHMSSCGCRSSMSMSPVMRCPGPRRSVCHALWSKCPRQPERSQGIGRPGPHGGQCIEGRDVVRSNHQQLTVVTLPDLRTGRQFTGSIDPTADSRRRC